MSRQGFGALGMRCWWSCLVGETGGVGSALCSSLLMLCLSAERDEGPLNPHPHPLQRQERLLARLFPGRDCREMVPHAIGVRWRAAEQVSLLGSRHLHPAELPRRACASSTCAGLFPALAMTLQCCFPSSS